MNSFSSFGNFRRLQTKKRAVHPFSLISQNSKYITFDFIGGDAYTDLSNTVPYAVTTAGLNLNHENTTLARLKYQGNPLQTSDFASSSFTIYLKYLSPANNNTIYPFGKQYPSVFGLSTQVVFSGNSFVANFYSLLDPGTSVSYSVVGDGIGYLTGAARTGTVRAPYETLTYLFTRSGYVIFPTTSNFSMVPSVTIPSPLPYTTYTVTVVDGVFRLNDLQQYYPTLTAGNVYLFDQSSPTNTGNTLVFGESIDSLTNYTTGVITNRIAGSTGAYTLLNFTSQTPMSLLYYSNSVALMGDRYPPGVPTINSTTIGGGSVSIAVTQPANTGGKTYLTGDSSISSYTVAAATLLSGVYTIRTTAIGTSTPITVTGLTGGTSYYFKVAATNTYGDIGNYSVYTSVAAIPRYPAGAPTGVTASSGLQSATVTFTAPTVKGGTTANNATSLSSYTVIAATLENGQYYPFSSTTSSSSSITIVGLTNGNSYYFKVAATNSPYNDLGTYSSYTTTAVIPRTTPSAPTNLSTVIGGGSVSVSFIPPIDNGGVSISYYTVSAATFSDSIYTPVTTKTGSSSPIIVTELMGGTAYYFKVSATNIYGETGTYSPYTSEASTPRYPAGAPTSITTSLGNQSVTVSFVEPILKGGTTENNATSIISYSVIAATLLSGVYYPVFTTTLPSTSITVSQLTNGTSYYFKVAATNDLFDLGTYSTYTTAVIPRTIPGVPINVATTNGSESVSVSFVQPTDTGGASILSYNVVCATLLSGVYTVVTTTTGSSSPILITGLTSGSSYYFKVAAINTFGESGSYSAYTSVAAVPNSMVNPINNFNVVGVGSNCFTCTWKTPSPAVTTYRLVYNNGTSDTTVDIQSSSLTKNVQYDYLGYTFRNIVDRPTSFTVTLSCTDANFNSGSISKSVSNTILITNPVTNANYSYSNTNSFTVIKFTASVASFTTPKDSSDIAVSKAALILVGTGGSGGSSGGGSFWEAGGGSGGGVALYPLYSTYSITPSTTTSSVTIGATAYGSYAVSTGNTGAVGGSTVSSGAGGTAISQTVNGVTFTSGAGGSGQSNATNGSVARCASTVGVNLIIPEMDISYNFSGGGGGGIDSVTGGDTMSNFVSICNARNLIYGGGKGGNSAGTNPTIAAGGATAGRANTGGGGGGKGEPASGNAHGGGSGVLYMYYSTYNFTVS